MIAISSASLSLTSTGTIGTSCRPASCDARQRRSPAMISKRSCAPFTGAHHDRLDHAVLLDRRREFAEFGIGKRPARIARIGFQEFDRHLALRARPLDMRGLAADIADQTCKTAAQSRTRFVGHRQLPWIHADYSELEFVTCRHRERAAQPITVSRDHRDGHRFARPS